MVTLFMIAKTKTHPMSTNRRMDDRCREAIKGPSRKETQIASKASCHTKGTEVLEQAAVGKIRRGAWGWGPAWVGPGDTSGMRLMF